MPFTLGLTAEEKRAADNAAIRLSNLRGVDFRHSSYLYALFVLEEARNMTGRARLFANAYEDIQHLAEVVTGARHPEATVEWYEEERRAHLARTLLSLAYLNSVQEWIDAARIVMRRWRFNEGSDGEPPELPKVGWQRRDLIERALEELGDAVSLGGLPSTWVGYSVIPSLRHMEPGVEGDPVDSEDEAEAEEDEGELDTSDDDDSDDDDSDNDESDDDDEDEDSDDDFRLVIRGSRLNTPPPSSSPSPESNELRRTQGGIPEVIGDFDSDDDSDDYSDSDDESDENEYSTDNDEDANGFGSDSESDDAPMWDTPNSEEEPGAFVNGRFIQ